MIQIPSAAVECLRAARRVAVLTGAGVSAESGIPTFRDAMLGMWAKFDPAELATPEAFARNPRLVSQWYDERRCQVARCSPNPGHLALAQMEERVTASGGRFTLITQNVDGLHQAAGSREVLELHGSLRMWRCVSCGREAEEHGPEFGQYPPTCACGGMRRPGVVWFGEMLPARAMKAAESAARACELFLSVGTSSVVYPAAGLIEQAMAAGARVLEVNPEETPFTRAVDWSIRAKGGEALPRVVEMAFGE